MVQSGQIITASSNLNWTTQTQVFNYTTYGPNLVDYSSYVALLNTTLTRVTGLKEGEPNNPCSPGDDRLDRWESLIGMLHLVWHHLRCR